MYPLSQDSFEYVPFEGVTNFTWILKVLMNLIHFATFFKKVVLRDKKMAKVDFSHSRRT